MYSQPKLTSDGPLTRANRSMDLIRQNNKFGIRNKNEQRVIYNVPYNSSLFSYKVMGYISPLPNKLHPTGIQLNSIKVSFTGHRGEALLHFDSLPAVLAD